MPENGPGTRPGSGKDAQKGDGTAKPGTKAEVPTVELSEQVRIRYEKLARLRDRKENPYKNGFTPKDVSSSLHRHYDEKTKEELETAKVEASVAGRMMMIRDFGKASFVRLKDRNGVIQLFVQKDKLGEEGYAQFKELDIGDIVYAKGSLFKTKTNELSVNCDELKLLTKSLRPLPEKFHGISDVEIKYRQRYLDLITSDETRETFRKRSRIVEEVRRFFVDHGFMEVETPMMHPIAGGATARPFVTHHNTLDMELYMRIAPELYLKRLVVGGFDRVFEINRNFRNEGVSIKHNPEFTMLEFYQAYANYHDLMDLTEELVKFVATEVNGTLITHFNGTEIDLGKWERLTMREAIIKWWPGGLTQPPTQADFCDRGALQFLLERTGAQAEFPHAPAGSDEGYFAGFCKVQLDELAKGVHYGRLVAALFEFVAEKHLVQPTIIYEFPLAVSPLSKQKPDEPEWVERFEFYIGGFELGNAFSELNDPEEQRRRFEEQLAQRAAGDEEAHQMDLDYVRALAYGLPPTAGEGIGIDRLTMVLTGARSIRDVILFPLLRPEGSSQ